MNLKHTTVVMNLLIDVLCDFQNVCKAELSLPQGHQSGATSKNKLAVLWKWSATLFHYFSAVMKLLIIGSRLFLGGKIVGKSQIHSLSLNALMLLFSLRKLKYNSRLLFFKVWTENIKYWTSDKSLLLFFFL